MLDIVSLILVVVVVVVVVVFVVLSGVGTSVIDAFVWVSSTASNVIEISHLI